MEIKDVEGGSHITDLMGELGMTTEPEATDTDGSLNDDDKSDESQENLSVSNEADDKTGDKGTEPNPEMASLQSQIEGLEKRMKDKDDYINKLKDGGDDKDDKKSDDDTEDEDEETFWDKPEETIKGLQEQIQMQQIQLQESIYANGVENYFETVNGDTLKEAVSSDAEFAKEFQNSKEPYKVAYEYLTNKKTEAKTDLEAERAKMKEEILAEIKADSIKAPATISGLGGSNQDGNIDVPEDGFAAVFG